MSCNGEAMLPDCGVTLYSYRPEIHGFQLAHQLLSNHSLNKSIRSWMVRAAGVVCDVVMLQKAAGIPWNCSMVHCHS